MFTLAELEAARATVYEAMPPTPQYAWPLLGERLGATVWVKHENHTPTGAFKVRGGLTYVDALLGRDPACPGLVTSTRGNHGQSLAFAGARRGLGVTIVVPHGNSREKNAAMRAFGATLIEHGEDYQAARGVAARLADERGLHFVGPFHRDLVIGVATYAHELLSAVPDLGTLYVPVGMGSGICACIAVRDLLEHPVRIIGVQAEGAPAYARSFAAGRVVSTDGAVSHADGLATRVPDGQAVAMIAAGAERVITVSDALIRDAIEALWVDTHNLAEGAAAASLAGAMAERGRSGGSIGVVHCGGNIDLALFRSWVLG